MRNDDDSLAKNYHSTAWQAHTPRHFAHQSSLRLPVHSLIRLTGPGPIAQTVRDPAAICVRPASATT
jgi:hypothetical protein